ncbi:MAG: LamG domain-containing protein [Planctomycetota bacterium]
MSKDNPVADPLPPADQFRRLADGQTTPDEFQAIESRLATDAGYRADYVRFMDLEASLYEELSLAQPRASAATTVTPQTTTWGWRRVVRRLSIAAVSLTVLLAGSWVWVRMLETSANTQFVEAQLKGLEDAAVVTHSSGIQQNPNDRPLMVGTRLKPGVLLLRQGELQIDFLSGARLLLRAPAELHVLSSISATLVSGSVAARVTEGAGKFMLRAPDAAIGESGTEFAINVNVRGDSDVHVYAGDVEVSLLGDDGNTLFSKRLSKAETVHIDRALRNVRTIKMDLDSFAVIRELERSRLVVTHAYYEAVQRSKPMLYWRFDSQNNGQIRNEFDTKYAGQIITEPDDASSISVSGGVAHFTRSNAPRYIKSAEPLAAINRKSFSMEVWINPETFHWGTVMNLIVPGTESRKEVLHMGILELAMQTQMVHKPSVVRYLHRHPPGAHTWGSNLFSPEVCTPGQWTHVVTVKEPNELRLFVNGVLVRRIQGADTAGSDENPYLFSVGQFGTAKRMRQFQGMLDELAVYSRALSEVEVSEHYWTMVSASRPIDPAPGGARPRPTAQRALFAPGNTLAQK